MKTFLFSIVATATALVGFSQPASAAGWGTQTTITGLDISGTGFFLYLKTASMQNPDGCTNSDRLLIDVSVTRYKELYAALLAAQMNGASVALYYDGCTSGYPKISSIALPNIW